MAINEEDEFVDCNVFKPELLEYIRFSDRLLADRAECVLPPTVAALEVADAEAV